MPDKDPQPHDRVQLRGPPNGDPLPDWYEVVQLTETRGHGKASIQVRDPSGGLMRVHKSRISRIARAAETKISPPQAGKEAKVTDKEAPATATAAVAEKPAAPKPVAKQPVKPVKPAKPAKEEPKPVPFDLAGWVKEHGGVHLSNDDIKFDHKGFKLVAHVAVDEKGGFYHTLNTYFYPKFGIVSLGKKNIGGNKYPLKGHKLTIQQESKKGVKTSRLLKGSETAEEVVARYEKKGYKRVA